jgi:hypothetical protein
MLHVYLFETKPDCMIDLSRIPSSELANECIKIMNHHNECIIFFGFLEPGFMLDMKDEAVLRRCIRKFECHLICFHLESLPFSWKNEIEFIYSKNQKNGSTKVINNGCTLQHEL